MLARRWDQWRAVAQTHCCVVTLTHVYLHVSAKSSQALLNVEKLTFSNVQTPAASPRPCKGERGQEKKLTNVKNNMFQNQFVLFALSSF